MKLQSVDLKKIKIDDPFWSKHVKLVKESVIPYQWDAMNDLIAEAQQDDGYLNTYFTIKEPKRDGKICVPDMNFIQRDI